MDSLDRLGSWIDFDSLEKLDSMDTLDSFDTVNSCDSLGSLDTLHCKPSPFDKQFYMANAAILTSNITFLSNQKNIFQLMQMCSFDIHICAFGQD